jgi:uncharacterized membrane protein YhaH (DUF805 family)
LTFTQSIRTCFSKYVTFSGRASRSEFWYFSLFLALAGFAFSVIDAMLFLQSDIGLLSPIFSITTFVPSIAVSVRRLHDVDFSGSWLLIVFVPIIGWIFLLILAIRIGTQGANRFGADPLSEHGNSNSDGETRNSSIPKVGRPD